MAKVKELTELERIAVFYAAIKPGADWEQLFRLSHPGYCGQNPAVSVSHWKNSNKVQEVLKEAQDEIAKRVQATSEKSAKNPEERDSAQNSEIKRIVDYSDPAEQRRKLNELVNQAEDSREVLDALKTIISTQKDDREAAREKKQVRVYLPLRCKACPLYLAKEKELKEQGKLKSS